MCLQKIIKISSVLKRKEEKENVDDVKKEIDIKNYEGSKIRDQPTRRFFSFSSRYIEKKNVALPKVSHFLFFSLAFCRQKNFC